MAVWNDSAPIILPIFSTDLVSVITPDGPIVGCLIAGASWPARGKVGTVLSDRKPRPT